jgi:enoyl-CoA hydratase/carnithine racemase
MALREVKVSADDPMPAHAEEATTPVVAIERHRATVRLNRPRHLNRIEPADIAALLGIFEQLDADPAIRVVVLTATGRVFSAGYHLGDLEERTGRPSAGASPGSSFERLTNRLEGLRPVTICRLNGGVYGGATDLALCCDFRIGAAGCELVMPAAKLGLHYYRSGVLRYVSRLGLNAAKKLFLTGQRIGAEEMVRIGYLDAAVPAEELDAAVDVLAGLVAANAPRAVQDMKRTLNELARGELDPAAADARHAASLASADLREGIAAFREKRPPVFSGR